MRRLLIALVLLASGVAGCASVSTTSPASGASGAPGTAPGAASSGAGGLADAQFAWCIDARNALALNKAAGSLDVDLDRLQAQYTPANGGTVEQYQAALRADAGYAKACRQAYSSR